MKPATAAAQHLTDMIEQIARYRGKVQAVYSVSDLLAIAASTGVKLPLVGVMYEGARASGDNKVGASGEMVFSVILLTETSVISKRSDFSEQAQGHLDEMRESIQGTRATTGHLWKWILEAPASHKNNVSVWIQRWSTNFAVTPKKAIGSSQ